MLLWILAQVPSPAPAPAVAPGGPSAPAWAFFTAISLALIAIVPLVINSFLNSKQARISADQAAKNTQAVSNGFAGTVTKKLDDILKEQSELRKDHSEHLEWHLNNPK